MNKKINGYKVAGIYGNIKKKKEKDLGIILSDEPCNVAGVFTLNKVKAAPVVYCMDMLNKGKKFRGVIVNSGVANAFTGKKGMGAATDVVKAAEKEFNLKENSLFVSSTGVIGGPLPVAEIKKSLPKLSKNLKENNWDDFAASIMTTDLVPKIVYKKVKIAGRVVSFMGVAKGSGMICPNMATMLSYIVTDAKVSSGFLKSSLKESVDNSFNSIIVDNDASTNDTVLLFANGLAGGKALTSKSSGAKKFKDTLNEISLELSHKIVRDGEGATKFIEIHVKGAKNNKQAEMAARTVAESMLVKTAFFGEDPNWGRIIAAIGRAGVTLNEDKIDLNFGKVRVLKNGLFTGKENEAARELKKKNIVTTINLNIGKGEKKVWTTDLSYGYVKINADYRS